MNNRDEAIYEIRRALKARRQPGDPVWSVKGGRGTAWGWIKIDAPPSARTWRSRRKEGATTDYREDYEEYDTHEPGGNMSQALRARLGELFGLGGPCHRQGISIASSHDYYKEYMERARGVAPSKIAEPYWD